jgi:arylsulfatase A-like enzyme
MNKLVLVLTFLLLPAQAILAQPNILWITTEDQSPILGAYGDSRAVTPNLDRLAAQGTLYRNAFASAPICAPARSTLITGVHATSLGTPHLRSEIPIPDSIRILPEYLREQGYFTTNSSKTDYNFSADGRWDENRPQAHWRNRPPGRPFFSVFNFTRTHEGSANSLDEDFFGRLKTRQDPAAIQLPPYYPDTPEMRRIWARYYDLIALIDLQVGDVLRELEADGLLDETIIFFFSDHGHGLPRYKRWLYHTGLHVPLIVRVPEKYRTLAGTRPGEKRNEIVSFVDLAPTVLNLTGVSVPPHMQGRPVLGPNRAPEREYMVATRDRADDVYEVSRAVLDNQYIYIRHYLPHDPYIQSSDIFSERKAGFRELHRARAEGLLPPAGEAMYGPKGVEELYDLTNDPHELKNLAGSSEQSAVMERMRLRLRNWILETKDTGFLNEAEVMIRSEGSSPYEMARAPNQYDLERILEAAAKVGDPTIPVRTLSSLLRDRDSGVRYWAAMALQARGQGDPAAIEALQGALTDASPIVQITAAESLCVWNHGREALPVLSKYLKDDRPWLALQAAISVRRLGNSAAPILEDIRETRRRYSGSVGGGRYRDWLYAMFIGFAMDQALKNIGAEL